jgi:hypothetical protein
VLRKLRCEDALLLSYGGMSRPSEKAIGSRHSLACETFSAGRETSPTGFAPAILRSTAEDVDYYTTGPFAYDRFSYRRTCSAASS